MSKPLLNRTLSSTSLDPKISRATEIRRDTDTIKTPKVGLYDIDYAIYWFIRERIRPYIVDNGNIVEVPVIFSNGETWAQVQKHGYLRDKEGKQITPLITIRRTGMSERDDLRKLDVNLPQFRKEQNMNVMFLQSKYTKNNTYDRFSILNNVKPTKEFYTLAIPEYVLVSYEIYIWAEYTEQLNNIVEMLLPAGGYAWGDTWKFITHIRDFSYEVTNTAAEDRIVRATSALEVKGQILIPYEYRVSNLQKSFSVKRVVFGNEFETDNSQVDYPPPGGYPNNTGDNFKKIHRRFDQ